MSSKLVAKYNKPWRMLLVASVGGALEMYDFVIYIQVSPIVSEHFFPQVSPSSGIIAALLVFMSGYIVRPLGGVLFSQYGDRVGRRHALRLSMVLMGVATTAVGLLPTYQQIGIWAPILLLLARTLQGIAVGGDFPGAITFVSETMPAGRGSFFCSVVFAGINLGILFAAGVTLFVGMMMPSTMFHSWGWRLGFLFGSVLFIIAAYIRRHVQESTHFTSLQCKSKQPVMELFRSFLPQTLKSIGLMLLFSITIAQLFIFMPTFLQVYEGFSIKESMILNAFSLLCFCLLLPLMGLVADKLGRRVVLFWSALGSFTFSYPLYVVLGWHHIEYGLLALFGLDILAAMLVSGTIYTLSQQFDTAVRYTGVAFSYNMGIAVFSSMTPLLCLYWLHNWNNTPVVALNLMLSACIVMLLTWPKGGQGRLGRSLVRMQLN